MDQQAVYNSLIELSAWIDSQPLLAGGSWFGGSLFDDAMEAQQAWARFLQHGRNQDAERAVSIIQDLRQTIISDADEATQHAARELRDRADAILWLIQGDQPSTSLLALLLAGLGAWYLWDSR